MLLAAFKIWDISGVDQILCNLNLLLLLTLWIRDEFLIAVAQHYGSFINGRFAV